MPTAHALVPTLVPQALISRADRRLGVGQPDRGDLRTRARRADLRAQPGAGRCDLRSCFSSSRSRCVTLIEIERPPPPREPPTFCLGAGRLRITSARGARLLGVITLDLFVVLLGGATALLPIYARDILEVGPIGLGLLRSAPAVGALTTAICPVAFSGRAAYRPQDVRRGRRSTASRPSCSRLSTWFPLSLVALAVLGASDAVSVVIRFSLVQIETPDDMRGRVSAINYLFVGISNTLGEFESGAGRGAGSARCRRSSSAGSGRCWSPRLWMMLFPGSAPDRSLSSRRTSEHREGRECTF